MKIILTTAAIVFFTLPTIAQLQIRRNGTELISTFAFSQSHDTLTITKTGGTGPCPMNSKGIYRIVAIENGAKFELHLIKEECPGRATRWIANPFERLE